MMVSVTVGHIRELCARMVAIAPSTLGNCAEFCWPFAQMGNDEIVTVKLESIVGMKTFLIEMLILLNQ